MQESSRKKPRRKDPNEDTGGIVDDDAETRAMRKEIRANSKRRLQQIDLVLQGWRHLDKLKAVMRKGMELQLPRT